MNWLARLFARRFAYRLMSADEARDRGLGAARGALIAFAVMLPLWLLFIYWVWVR